MTIFGQCPMLNVHEPEKFSGARRLVSSTPFYSTRRLLQFELSHDLLASCFMFIRHGLLLGQNDRFGPNSSSNMVEPEFG